MQKDNVPNIYFRFLVHKQWKYIWHQQMAAAQHQHGPSVTSSSYCKQAVRALLLHSSHSEVHSSHHCFTSADQVISRTRDHLQYFYHLSMLKMFLVPKVRSYNILSQLKGIFIEVEKKANQQIRRFKKVKRVILLLFRRCS